MGVDSDKRQRLTQHRFDVALGDVRRSELHRVASLETGHHVANADGTPGPAYLVGVPPPFERQAGGAVQSIRHVQCRLTQIADFQFEREMVAGIVGVRALVVRHGFEAVMLAHFDILPRKAFAERHAVELALEDFPMAFAQLQTGDFVGLLGDFCAT